MGKNLVKKLVKLMSLILADQRLHGISATPIFVVGGDEFGKVESSNATTFPTTWISFSTQNFMLIGTNLLL